MRLLLSLFLLIASPLQAADDPCLAGLRAEEPQGFSGAVLIGDGDSVVSSAEFGAAARDDHPTAFWIASISKPITATAVMQLVERGSIELDAPISRYFPEAPQSMAAITVHHLLAHRSGLPHAYATDGIVDREAAARALLNQKLAKPLGEFLYSNDGYNLLAILIERASKESYQSFVRKNIFERAGMTSAGFWGEESQPTSVAPPNQPPKRIGPNIWRDGRSVANWGYRGATGLYATPLDLFRFARAFLSGSLLSEKSMQSMLTSKKPSFGPNGQTYGYGWALRYVDGKAAEVFHGGNESWLGHNGMLLIIGTRTYVILSNSGDIGGVSWAARIESRLRACSLPGG